MLARRSGHNAGVAGNIVIELEVREAEEQHNGGHHDHSSSSNVGLALSAEGPSLPTRPNIVAKRPATSAVHGSIPPQRAAGRTTTEAALRIGFGEQRRFSFIT